MQAFGQARVVQGTGETAAQAQAQLTGQPPWEGGPSAWYQCWSRPLRGRGQGQGTSSSDTWAWRRSPRRTSLTWVCTGPPSRLCTTALAIRVRWPMFPRLMPPAALKERVASGLPPALLCGASTRPGLGPAASHGPPPRGPHCPANLSRGLACRPLVFGAPAPHQRHSTPRLEVRWAFAAPTLRRPQACRPVPSWGCEC